MVGRWFRYVTPTSIIKGFFVGLGFGLLDTCISMLVCYSGVALWSTFSQWNHRWQQPGDGMRIFISAAQTMVPETQKLLIAGALFGLVGGIVIGVLASLRNSRSGASKQVGPVAPLG
jgi:uncharacterized membrane protein YdjX (TVP38/TMEM64 family)